ncbi:MAG: IS701 family transposase [Endomicrobium sp.]|nr:IS701 family transposase [Endomicrobium sp.]
MAVGINPEKLEIICEIVEEYLTKYNHCFKHVAQKVYFRIYIQGLLSDLERKSVEPIALKYANESSVRSLQKFIKSSPMLDDELLYTYQRLASETVAYEDGMITVDGCDFVKRGNESVGVSRQYCGTLGKKESCQASVMIGYSGEKGYALIMNRLFMPKKWMSDDYADRRKKCGVPDDLKFQTKNEIASDLLNSVYKTELFRAKWVGADSAFGHDTKFLEAIPEGLYYVANVHSDDMFYEEMPELTSPEWSGRGRKPVRLEINGTPKEVRNIIEENHLNWKKVEFGYGSKGLITGEEIILRVVDIRDGLPNKWVWLYARKWNDGNIKYMISNAPEDTPPEKFRELSLRRWAIEQCFEECKSLLGMDHYEERSWNGWHRHVLIVCIAHLFLQILKNKFSANFDQLSKDGKKLFKQIKYRKKTKDCYPNNGDCTLFCANAFFI